MISNVYLMAKYNQYVNNLNGRQRSIIDVDPKLVTGNMLLVKNNSSRLTLAMRDYNIHIKPMEEAVVPEEVWDTVTPFNKKDFRLVSMFYVSGEEFKKIRSDLNLWS